MNCYKSMTFCRGDGCIKFHGCRRALTTEARAEAARLELRICEFAEPRALGCWTDRTLTPASDPQTPTAPNDDAFL